MVAQRIKLNLNGDANQKQLTKNIIVIEKEQFCQSKSKLLN